VAQFASKFSSKRELETFVINDLQKAAENLGDSQTRCWANYRYLFADMQLFQTTLDGIINNYYDKQFVEQARS